MSHYNFDILEIATQILHDFYNVKLMLNLVLSKLIQFLKFLLVFPKSVQA